MSQVVSFESYRPAPRFDSVPWTEVRIEEGADVAGPFTLIDTITLDPVDADPSNPATRDFTTDQASDDAGLWYRITFADGGGSTSLPLFPVQNSAGRPYYATVEELARLLKVDADVRRDQLERVLTSAATEIDGEIGPTDINGDTTPYASPPAIVVEVSIERAYEHWMAMTTPFGALGLGADTGPSFISADSWRRHAEKLSFLKGSWALA